MGRACCWAGGSGLWQWWSSMQVLRRHLSVRMLHIIMIYVALNCTVPGRLHNLINVMVAALLVKGNTCHSWRGSYPQRGVADLTLARLLPSDLGVLAGNCSAIHSDEKYDRIELPGYSIVSISLWSHCRQKYATGPFLQSQVIKIGLTQHNSVRTSN